MGEQRTAVAYLRVSTVEQAAGEGLGVQRDAITAWADTNGVEVVEWCSDVGVSGSNGIDSREALGHALSLVHNETANMLVVYRLDRLARDLVVSETILARVESAGGRVVSVTETDIDSGDPTRVLIRQVLGALAQYERTVIVGRMSAAKQAMKARGEYAGGRLPSYVTWDGERFVVDPVKVRPVVRAVELRRAGLTMGLVTRALNDEGWPAPAGGVWERSSLRRVVYTATGVLDCAAVPGLPALLAPYLDRGVE